MNRKSVGTQTHPDEDQFSRFVETARALGCDEDKKRFEANLAKIAKPTIKSKADTDMVVGAFNERSVVPNKVRSIMRANSQGLANLTMKSPC
jgi:hypothetical protein